MKNDVIEEWRQWRDARFHCCKCIVQGQTMVHCFTDCNCITVDQIHTKFSRNHGNFIVNLKSQFIWMYWKIKWRHLTNDITMNNWRMETVRVLLQHLKLNKTPTTTKQLHTVNILIFCTSTEHVFNASAVLSHYELHTTTPFTNVLVTTKFWSLIKLLPTVVKVLRN